MRDAFVCCNGVLGGAGRVASYTRTDPQRRAVPNPQAPAIAPRRRNPRFGVPRTTGSRAALGGRRIHLSLSGAIAVGSNSRFCENERDDGSEYTSDKYPEYV